MDSYLQLFFIFLFISFFCSGSETTFFSLSQVTIDDLVNKYPKRGKILLSLLKEPKKLLITILITNIFANIFLTIIANKIMDRINIYPLFKVIIITLIILIFGETTPKTLAINFNRKVVLFITPIFYTLRFVYTPLIFIMNSIANFLVKINGFLFFRNSKEENNYSLDEMFHVVKNSKEKGVIEEIESDILKNIIKFSDTDIWKLKTPKEEMFTISVDSYIDEAIVEIKKYGFSRIPIWEDSEDNIIGILNCKDILRYENAKKSTTTRRKKLSYLRKYFYPVHFVPDSISADKLLEIFNKNKTHIAIVIDEFGGVSGLITLQDVIESVIGEIIDRNEIKPLYYKYNEEIIEVEGRMELADFNDVFNIYLTSNEVTTIGGYLIEKIGKIPKTGEIFIIDNLQFKVLNAKPTKIEKLLITKMHYKSKTKINFFNKKNISNKKNKN